MTNQYKTKTGIDLMYTLYLSGRSTQSCVVLLPGIPYDPLKEYDFIEDLMDQHDVYMIHYDGTWGSSGKFLAQNPAASIHEFMSALKQGVLLNNTSKSYKNIFVIGTSFGGALALTLKDNPTIQAICALSPVISFRSVRGIDTLGTYLQKQCAGHYTFEPKDMDALIADQIIAPEKQMTLPAKKLLAFAGEYDEQIPINDVSAFCLKHNIPLHTLSMGHITFSKVNSDIYQKVILFFEENNH